VFVENSSYFTRAMSHGTYSETLSPSLAAIICAAARCAPNHNGLLIAVLSFTAAYFITRPTGGTGFPARKLAAKAESTPGTALHSPADAPPTAAVPSATDASGYELEARSSRRSPRLKTRPPEWRARIICDSYARSPQMCADRVFICDEDEASRNVSLTVLLSAMAPGRLRRLVARRQHAHWATNGYVTIQPTHEDFRGAASESGGKIYAYAGGSPTRSKTMTGYFPASLG